MLGVIETLENVWSGCGVTYIHCIAICSWQYVYCTIILSEIQPAEIYIPPSISLRTLCNMMPYHDDDDVFRFRILSFFLSFYLLILLQSQLHLHLMLHNLCFSNHHSTCLFCSSCCDCLMMWDDDHDSNPQVFMGKTERMNEMRAGRSDYALKSLSSRRSFIFLLLFTVWSHMPSWGEEKK